MSDQKKSLFDKAIDAITSRDEKAAAEKGQAQAAAAQKEAAALRARLHAEKAAAEKAAALKATAEKVAAEKAAAFNAAPEKALAAPKKAVVTTRSLRVRKDHSTASEVVAGLVDGQEIMILATWSDGRNTWAQLENGWAAMVHDGETYIQFSSR